MRVRQILYLVVSVITSARVVLGTWWCGIWPLGVKHWVTARAAQQLMLQAAVTSRYQPLCAFEQQNHNSRAVYRLSGLFRNGLAARHV